MYCVPFFVLLCLLKVKLQHGTYWYRQQPIEYSIVHVDKMAANAYIYIVYLLIVSTLLSDIILDFILYVICDTVMYI